MPTIGRQRRQRPRRQGTAAARGAPRRVRSHVVTVGGSPSLAKRPLRRACRLTCGIECLVASVVVALPGPVSAAGDGVRPDPRRLLQELRALDAVYNAGMTIRGRQTSYPRPGDTVRPATTFELQFTWHAPRNALSLTAIGVPRPVPDRIDLEHHRPAGPFDTGRFPTHGLVSTPTGDVTLSIPVAMLVFFDSDQSANLTTSLTYQVHADGSYNSRGEANSLHVDPGDSPGWSLPYKRVIWCSGRLLSPFLTDIRSVEPLENGRLEAIADGFDSTALRGQWKFEVDPAAGYLVRSAAFSDGGQEVYSLSNEQLVTANEVVFPRTARFTTHAVGQVDEFQFESMTLSPDEEFLRTTEAAIKSRNRPNTFVRDSRTKDPIIAQIDAKGHLEQVAPTRRTAPPDLREVSASLRLWLLFANLTAIVLLAGRLLIRRQGLRN
jgi:hypothetical protein